MNRIACHPAKSSIKIGYQFSHEYYDVTEVVNIDDGIGDLCCLENWGDCLLYAANRNDLDRMEDLYQRIDPKSKPIHIAWDGQGSWGNIFTIMVPENFKHGDPIYFNTDTRKIEFV